MALRDAKETALSFYNNTYEAKHKQYLSMIASPDLADVRTEYLQLFEWTPSVLESLRILTDKLFFKGESQHIDTILQAFADSWFEKHKDNNSVNFTSSNGVYLISYSLILLNTDVHTAEGLRKHISKADYVKNTLDALASNNIQLTGNKQNIESELNKYYDQLLNNELKLVNSRMKRSAGDSGDNSSIYSANSSILSPALNSTTARSFGFASLLLNERSLKKQPSRESLGSNYTTSQASAFTMKTGMSMSQLSNLNEIDDESEGEETLLVIVEEEGDLELELDGPPWIKEGLLNVIMVDNDPETTPKQQSKFNFLKSKPNNSLAKWRYGFVVVSKGELRIFSFDNPSANAAFQPKVKSKRSIMGLGFGGSTTTQVNNQKFNQVQIYGPSEPKTEPVGGGNWYENANCFGSFNLCQTYASKPTEPTLVSLRMTRSEPAKNLGHVYWSLTLPLQNAHCKKHTKLVFQCGSEEIAREFIETCNFWAARSSNVPNENTTVSSYEYGWSKHLIQLVDALNTNKKDIETLKSLNSLRITDWSPLLTSNLPTNLVMNEQLQKLKSYYMSLKQQLEEHQLVKSKIDLLNRLLRENKVSSHPVHTQSSFSLRRRAPEVAPATELNLNIRLILNNYNKKLNYLNRESLKYKKYLNSLTNAIKVRKDKLDEESSSSDGVIEPFKVKSDIFEEEDEFGLDTKIIMVGSEQDYQ